MNARFAALVRWLHIYLSMLGFAALLLFGVTGLTLNHPDWFTTGVEQRRQLQGTMNLEWLSTTESRAAGTSDENSVDKLAIVEHLRREHEIRAALEEFRVDEYECLLMFKGPGYSADVFVDRDSGSYELSESRQGLVAVLNDLHKGRHTSPAWSWAIDVSAIATVAISLTGFLLLFYIKRRRVSGLLVALAGGLLLWAIIWFYGELVGL